MEDLVQKSFSTNLRLMEIFGFYSSKKHTGCYRLYNIIVYSGFTVLMPLLAAMDVFLTETNLDKVSDNAFLICQSGCFIMKFLPFVINSNEVKKVIDMVECPQFVVHSENHKKIIDESIETCRNICRIFLTSCVITLVNWAIVPLFTSGNNLPLDIWLPFDYKTDKTLYIFSYIYVVAAVGNGALSSGVIDPLLAGLISHASGQIKLLKFNLQYLEEDAEEEIRKLHIDESQKNSVKCKLIYDKINVCVEHHNYVLSFVDMFEDTFSLSVFFQFSASVVVICISCLRLSMVKPFTFTFFAMILFLSTMLCEIFLFCFYGTVLVEENNNLITSIYMGQWYNYEIKSRKVLYTLMERSKRPMIITAGKVLDLSLETFTTILRRAYSLLAVLKNY